MFCVSKWCEGIFFSPRKNHFQRASGTFKFTFPTGSVIRSFGRPDVVSPAGTITHPSPIRFLLMARLWINQIRIRSMSVQTYFKSWQQIWNWGTSCTPGNVLDFRRHEAVVHPSKTSRFLRLFACLVSSVFSSEYTSMSIKQCFFCIFSHVIHFEYVHSVCLTVLQ